MTEHEYEQGSAGPGRSGWWVVLAICACLLAWGAVQYATIHDAPRQWDFGALPDAPGESVYSTSQPASPQIAPPQIEPLPEAQSRRALASPRRAPAGPTSRSADEAGAVDPAKAENAPTGGRP